MEKQKWTAENLPDLMGKVIIVTGANSGLGFETAKELIRKGAQTVLACRHIDRAQAALSQIQFEIPDASAEIMQLDLASLDAVRQFTHTFKEKYEHLDILINNAGLSTLNYSTTDDGYEMNLGVNHFGHFALTGLLLDSLAKRGDARVVSVSSIGHRMGQMDFDNLLYEDGKEFSTVSAYGRSKLATLLFTYELQRRFEAAGIGILSVAAHPGAARTNLDRSIRENWRFRLMAWSYERLGLMQSPAMGALPVMRAAVGTDVKGGEYYGPGGIMEFRGYPVKVQSSKASYNEEDARRLWELSEELTGVIFRLVP